MSQKVAKLFSAELDGIEAELIEVEADINVGLHSFNIVGLADKAVSEAKERVNSALKNSNIKPPNRENRRITVNLAPADIKKIGSRFDLPIAIAYLLASSQLKPFETKDKLFIGELSLDGTLRAVDGVLNIALLAQKKKIKQIILPAANAAEAAIVEEIEVIPVSNLTELIDHLEGRVLIKPQPKTEFQPSSNVFLSIDEIKGQAAAKRALLVAAAGGHNILMCGSPGAGKTMLAQAFLSILPPPTREESIEITRIWSSAGLNHEHPLINFRPFRSPHHSASLISLIGGGQNPKPGEISLAHRGVLFLDELPEFRRDALEALRQPLESGEVHVARAKKTLKFPARFIFIAAQNPCRCGYFGDPDKDCECSPYDLLRYQRRISGPLLDRLDIQLDVPRVPAKELRAKNRENQEAIFREKVKKAREIQSRRFANTNPKIYTNAEMSSKQIDSWVKFDSAAEDFLKRLLEKNFVSARGYYRILKVAQTIADLENSAEIKTDHLAEAFQYRIKSG